MSSSNKLLFGFHAVTVRLKTAPESITEIHVDAIDESPRRLKKERFADIARRHGWQPGEVLVVGDNAESEIAAGHELGMPTVQTLRPGVPPAPNARWRIKNFGELSKLIRATIPRL